MHTIHINVNEFSDDSSDLECEDFMPWFQIKNQGLEMVKLTTMLCLSCKSLKKMNILVFTVVNWF